MITDKIFAIDVGTTESGYAIMRFDKDDIKLLSFGKIANEALMQIIKNDDYDQLVYEQFQSFGMAVGESTIESILWNGRLIQAAIDRSIPVDRIYRKEEKLCLCNTLRAKDANIRQALIDRYAKTDKKNGKGTKKEPDVFFGVKKDVWSAIAVRERMKMKNDVNNTTEKLGVSKDEASSSDNKENRNTEIVNISMTVKRWYSVANLIYSLLVGYVWVRYIIGNPASRTILRLIGSIFVLMILCIPYAVKVEPLKAKLPIWLVCLAAFAALFALAIVGAVG